MTTRSSAQPGIQVFLWHDTPHITEHQGIVGNAELLAERRAYGARRPFLCINSIVNHTDELGGTPAATISFRVAWIRQ